MRKLDNFVIAAWAATIFGLMEGVVLVICRAYPAILAPYKVSVHALWIAPAINLILFLVIALALMLLTKLARRWLKEPELLFTYGFFVFLGFVTVLAAPRIIHWVTILILPLGLAAAFCRKLRGSEIALTDRLRRRLLWIPALIVLVGAGAWGYEKTREQWLFRKLPPAPHSAMNVLIVVLDTVRYDSFTRPAAVSLTPNLDRIAAAGARFQNAWSTTSWSLPSQAAILTGRYPHEHGADWPRFELDRKTPTLAEYFSGRGYVTGAFSSNAAWVTPEYLGRGFLRFDVYLWEDMFRRTVYGRAVGRALWELGYHQAGRGKKAPVLNAQFLKFLDDYRERPFFAYLCYMDVNRTFHHRWLNHAFWEQTPPKREVIEAYEQGLNTLDGQIGDLFGDLERRGVLKNTLVVITSDHGESFGAEDTDDHDPEGHGTSLYPEQTRVPMFVICPGKLPPGREVTQVTSTRAIPAIITRLLGLADSPFHGAALPAIESATEAQAAPALLTLNYNDSKIQAMIWDRWQYLKDLKAQSQREELYELTVDPMAKKNLFDVHPGAESIRRQLQQLLVVGSQTSQAEAAQPNHQTQAAH
ncbi:MAG: hypothetical protein JMDDDDMK_01325 [Acidobacteria bacterium]|nr:hypothetical protein [Acidobacteriota bacterium]